MGRNKSSSIKWLLSHIAVIYVVFWIGLWWLPPIKFALPNAIIHLVIDACTWNAYKIFTVYRLTQRGSFKERRSNVSPNFKWYEDHWFFTTIGIDQFLHFATLIILKEMFL